MSDLNIWSEFYYKKKKKMEYERYKGLTNILNIKNLLSTENGVLCCRQTKEVFSKMPICLCSSEW